VLPDTVAPCSLGFYPVAARVLSAYIGLSTQVNTRTEESATMWASCRKFMDFLGLWRTAVNTSAIPRNEGVSGSNPLVGFKPVPSDAGGVLRTPFWVKARPTT
jgi:hypothetical protein